MALLGGVLGALPAAATDIIARCNYDFDIRPGVYDRGSVQVTSNSAGFHMQFVQDDQITSYDKVVASTASGDQARDLIKKDANFSKFVSQVRIAPDQIVHVDAYAAPAAPSGGGPQARFFAFYGSDQRYLGGFGIFGKEPFTCDWVQEN